MDAQYITVGLTIAGAVGWVFKVWIISPLNASILRLNDSLNRIDGIVDKIQEQNIAILQDITATVASVKSAHKRIDELQERVHTLEMRCTDCCRRDD